MLLIVTIIGIIIFIILGIGAVIGLIIFFPMILALSMGSFGFSHAPSPTPEEILSTVYIPEGAHLQDSGKNFEPAAIEVVIGKDNKVRWFNEDFDQSSVLADDTSDPGFYNATHYNASASDPTAASSLYPQEIFDYTFTKAGTYGYHCSFHTWMRGSVVVLKPTQ